MSPGGRKLPADPNYWLLVGICLFGLLSLCGLVLTLMGLLPPNSWVYVALLLVVPGLGFIVVFGLHFGHWNVRFHPTMLISFLAILALSLLIYLNFAGVF
jgi:hypothetical protein